MFCIEFGSVKNLERLMNRLYKCSADERMTADEMRDWANVLNATIDVIKQLPLDDTDEMVQTFPKGGYSQ